MLGRSNRALGSEENLFEKKGGTLAKKVQDSGNKVLDTGKKVI